MYIVIAILMFGVLIFIHELGHYLTARLFRVSIREFAVGMGPKLLSKRSDKTGIVYSLRLLPIGGFVSMVGEDEASEDPNAFNNKKRWQRFLVLASGAIMNLALGLLLMCVLSVTTQNIGSTTIVRFDTEDASSMQTGLMPGDEIRKINGKSVHFSSDLVYTIMREGNEAVDVTVIRNGEKTVVRGVLFPNIVEEGVVFGSPDFKVLLLDRTPGVVVRYALSQSVWAVRMIWESLFDFITGRYGVDQMSGPVGVTSAISDAASSGGFANVVYLCALIAVNLGVFNLLPFPALDGGRIAFLLVECVRGKPIKPEYEGYVHFAGIVILMALMLVVTYKDIVKLFVS